MDDVAGIPVGVTILVFVFVPALSSVAQVLFPLLIIKSVVPSLCQPSDVALPGAAAQGLLTVAAAPKLGASNGIGITV